MSLSILQNQNVPSSAGSSGAPGATPTPAGLRADKDHFGNILKQAVKNDSPHRETKLPKGAKNQMTSKPEHHGKTGHAAGNQQTPAIPVIATDSVGNSRSEVGGGSSNDKTVAGNTRQRPSHGVQVLELLTARQFQPVAKPAQDAKEKAHSPANAQAALQLPDHAERDASNAPHDGQDRAKESPVVSPVSPALEQEVASLAAKSLPVPDSREVPNAGNVLNVPPPATGETSDRKEFRNPIRQADNAPVRTTEKISTQPPAHDPFVRRLSHLSDKHFEKALTDVENLQFNVNSATSMQAGTRPSPGTQDAKTIMPHKADAHLSPDSAASARQEQATFNFQSPAKDTSTSNSIAPRGSELPLQPTAAPAGSSNDSPMGGKPGQDSSSKHSEISRLANSVPAPSSGNFSSVAASAMAASPNSFAAVPAQVATASGTPAGNTPLPQPTAVHVTAPGTLPASVEPSTNSVGGAINSASLLQAQGKTEMRVALHTDNLGPLELHAVIDGGHLGASIAVFNHDAHTVLTNNLPALQQALTDQNLRLDHLSVTNTPMSNGTSTGSGGGFHSGGQAQSHPNGARWAFSRPLQIGSGSQEIPGSEQILGRLSVHA